MCHYPTYRKYTLEFLSSLKVIKTGRLVDIQQLSFRLGNQDRVLNRAQIGEIFGLQHEDEEDVDHNHFWSLITNETEFVSGKSKSSVTRNLVLRYLYRAISNVVFPRSDTGSVSNVELYLMHSLLKKKSVAMSHHIPAHWERIKRTGTGAICCGGHITRLCNYFDIELDEMEQAQGEVRLSFSLHHMEVVKIDTSLRAFVFQARDRDHFRLPCPTLTHVDTWDEDRSNWKMGTPAHRRVISAYPWTGYWKMHKHPLSSPIIIPAEEASSSRGHKENLEQEEEDEPQPQPVGTSYRYHRPQEIRRRDRAQREEEPKDSIAARLDRLQTQSDQMREQQHQWQGQFDQRWE